MPSKISRQRRAEFKRVAEQIRRQGQLQGLPVDQIAAAIRAKLPEVLPLEAWRFAYGWSRPQVIKALFGPEGIALQEKQTNSTDHMSGDHGFTEVMLCRWEHGHCNVSAKYAVLLCRLYRATPAQLGLKDEVGPVTLAQEAGVAPAGQEDDVDRRQFIGVAAAAPLLTHLDGIRERMNAHLRRGLPPAELDRWQATAAQRVSAYGRTPPALLLNQLTSDLAELADLTQRNPHQPELHLAASQMCGLTGALHTDLGHDRQAEDWLATAGHYARQSGDPAQRWWVAMAQAMTALYGPRPDTVISINSRARRELGNTPSAAAAQLAGLTARAYANTQPDRARAELERAHTLFDKLTAEQTGAVFFGFPRRELQMYDSQVLTAIGDPQAWDTQTTALAAYPDNDPMDRPLIQLDRARHILAAGDADEASKTAANAILTLPPELRVPLLLAQAHKIGDQIDAISPTAARTLRAKLAA
jgi:hypothetical protein